MFADHLDLVSYVDIENAVELSIPSGRFLMLLVVLVWFTAETLQQFNNSIKLINPFEREWLET